MIKNKTVFTGFSPNMTLQDVKTSCSYLFLPWNWFKLRSDKFSNKVEKWFRDFFSIKHAYTFDSGRSSLYFALKALNIGIGDEVLAPGYTCVVVPNAIKYTGAKPVYVDIKNDLNINTELIEEKISDKTKAIILQHTFGLPANIKKLREIADKHDLSIVEDCAHSLGAKYNNKKVGTFGDISIFSFGSNKVVSSVRGGIAITNNKKYGDKLKQYQKDLNKMKLSQVIKHLLYYPFFAIGKKLYSSVGKIILAMGRKLKMLANIMELKEKRGQKASYFPAKFPNSLANIALNQLEKLSKFQDHRTKLANIYKDKLPNKLLINNDSENVERAYLNFPILINNPEKIFNLAKKEGFIPGLDWTGSNIVPKDAKREEVYYNNKDCKVAENLSKKVLLLPNNINTSEEDVKRLCNLINNNYC